MTMFSSPGRENEILRKTVKILKHRFKDSRIILFGSRSKGRQGPSADFDLAIESSRPDHKTLREIREEIEKAAGLYGVDLVFLHNADPSFREMILKTGKICR